MNRKTGQQTRIDSSRRDKIHELACRGFSVRLLAVLGVCWMAFGCQSAPVVEPSLSATVTDSAADVLHEICEQLLIYYALNQSLPPNLEALSESGKPPLVSPGSGKPYFYHNPPLRLRGRTARLLIHDPAKAEATVKGRPARWVVLVTEPDRESDPGGPLTTQVILLSEAELGAALTAK